MAGRRGRGRQVRIWTGVGVDEDVYEPDQHSELEIEPRVKIIPKKERINHPVSLEFRRSGFVSRCLTCQKNISSRRLLVEVLDETVKHGKIIEILGAGERETEIWKMISKRLQVKRRRPTGS